MKTSKPNELNSLASSTRDGGGHVRAGAAGDRGGENSGKHGARARISTCQETRLGEKLIKLRKSPRREQVTGRK